MDELRGFRMCAVAGRNEQQPEISFHAFHAGSFDGIDSFRSEIGARLLQPLVSCDSFASERQKTRLGFFRRMRRRYRQQVRLHRKNFLAALFVELGEVIADAAVLREFPCGAKISLGTIEISAADAYPAERVPVGAEILHLREVVAGEVIEIGRFQRRCGCIDG